MQVYIYYTAANGGGSKRLFRKIGNKSSTYHPDEHEVRREGSYIYERFLNTGGSDVKVYTVGPDYAHAEARKSPVVDGRVQRNKQGKEIRYPVILSVREKLIARKVVLAFGLQICGFDLLRCNGHSYVCDVNGWSFVKTSQKYFDDSAQVIRAHLFWAMGRTPMSPSIRPVPSATADAAADESKAARQRARAVRRRDRLMAAADEQQRQDIGLGSANTGPAAAAADDEGGRLGEAGGTAAGLGGRGGDAARSISDDASVVASSAAGAQGTAAGAAASSGGTHATLSAGEAGVSAVNRSGTGASTGGTQSGPDDDEELVCVLGLIRHGDRTPKQKMKMKVSHAEWLKLFNIYGDKRKPTKEVKLKTAKQLQAVLDCTLARLARFGDLSRITGVGEAGGSGRRATSAALSSSISRIASDDCTPPSPTGPADAKTPDRWSTSAGSGAGAGVANAGAAAGGAGGSEGRRPRGFTDGAGDTRDAALAAATAATNSSTRATTGSAGNVKELDGNQLDARDTRGGSGGGSSSSSKVPPPVFNPGADLGTDSETYFKLEQLRIVLQMYEFTGINRKVQLKPLKWRRVPRAKPSSPSGKGGEPKTPQQARTGGFGGSSGRDVDTIPSPSPPTSPGTHGTVTTAGGAGLAHATAAMVSGGGAGVGAGAGTADSKDDDDDGEVEVVEALLVLKWGGELTQAGRDQAEQLGRRFRLKMYPSRKGDMGVLRLHSTFRHDLKIYSSDEGRVAMTAAAFAKGFLDLEGPLTPILASLVRHDDAATELLDNTKPAARDMGVVKQRLHTYMQSERDVDDLFIAQVNPTDQLSQRLTLESIKNPRVVCYRLYMLIKMLTEQLCTLCGVTQGHRWGTIPLVSSSSASASNAAAVGGPASSPDARGGMDDAPAVGRPAYLTAAARSSSTSSSGAGPSMFTSSSTRSLSSTAAADGSSGDGNGASGHDKSKGGGGVKGGANWHLNACETLPLMTMRWAKLEKDFFNKRSGKFDISKIPDIYDCIKYDVLHNKDLMLSLVGIPELYVCAKAMADIIIPQEYGISASEKLSIGVCTFKSLLRKLLGDLGAASQEHGELATENVSQFDPRYAGDHHGSMQTPRRHVRTRLYFTSESHVHALYNILRHGIVPRTKAEGSGAAGDGDLAATAAAATLSGGGGGGGGGGRLEGTYDETNLSRVIEPLCDWHTLLTPAAAETLDSVSELNYMTHIVIKLYERRKPRRARGQQRQRDRGEKAVPSQQPAVVGAGSTGNAGDADEVRASDEPGQGGILAAAAMSGGSSLGQAKGAQAQAAKQVLAVGGPAAPGRRHDDEEGHQQDGQGDNDDDDDDDTDTDLFSGGGTGEGEGEGEDDDTDTGKEATPPGAAAANSATPCTSSGESRSNSGRGTGGGTAGDGSGAAPIGSGGNQPKAAATDTAGKETDRERSGAGGNSSGGGGGGSSGNNNGSSGTASSKHENPVTSQRKRDRFRIEIMFSDGLQEIPVVEGYLNGPPPSTGGGGSPTSSVSSTKSLSSSSTTAAVWAQEAAQKAVGELLEQAAAQASRSTSGPEGSQSSSRLVRGSAAPAGTATGASAVGKAESAQDSVDSLTGIAVGTRPERKPTPLKTRSALVDQERESVLNGVSRLFRRHRERRQSLVDPSTPSTIAAAGIASKDAGGDDVGQQDTEHDDEATEDGDDEDDEAAGAAASGTAAATAEVASLARNPSQPRSIDQLMPAIPLQPMLSNSSEGKSGALPPSFLRQSGGMDSGGVASPVVVGAEIGRTLERVAHFTTLNRDLRLHEVRVQKANILERLTPPPPPARSSRAGAFPRLLCGCSSWTRPVAFCCCYHAADPASALFCLVFPAPLGKLRLYCYRTTV